MKKILTLLMTALLLITAVITPKTSYADSYPQLYFADNDWGTDDGGFEWHFGDKYSATTHLYKMISSPQGYSVIVGSQLLGTGRGYYGLEFNTKYVFRMVWNIGWYQDVCSTIPQPDLCFMGPQTPFLVNYYDIQWPSNQWVYDYASNPLDPQGGQYTYYVDYEIFLFMYYQNWWNPFTDMVTDIRIHKMGEGRGTLSQRQNILSARCSDPYCYYK